MLKVVVVKYPDKNSRSAPAKKANPSPPADSRPAPRLRGATRLGLSFTILALCALLLNTGCRKPPHTIRIRTLIDGADIVKIQGNRIWYVHESFDLPGRWAGRDDPTFINNQPWRPEWQDKTNVPYENLQPAFAPRSPPDIKLNQLDGRGTIKITQLPAPENNQTLTVRFDDGAFAGAAWYEATINWK